MPDRPTSSTRPSRALIASMFLLSFGMVLFELLLTRIFGVVLFASFAHLALALALMGISAGAVAQHLWPWLVPDRALEQRLAWISLAQGGATVLAVISAIALPVTIQSASAPERYGERSSIAWNLVDPWWFSVLLPLLTVPFALAGLAFAGVFSRRKEQIGVLYGADLLGGAAAALAFVPLLSVVSAPDAVFVVAAACGLSAALLQRERRQPGPAAAAGLFAAAPLVLLLGALVTGRSEVLPVRYAAGYSESQVTYVRWTPLTRLAVHEGERGTFVLLDNTSASEVVRDARRREELAQEPNRALVYRLHDPPARVAILAASAGPEVAVAQHFGFSDIDAIDIAPEIGDLVRERFDEPLNPFRQPGVHRVLLDGRAAILHADAPYDIIQMVHANLHSSAGQLANAWSPALLETNEAFHTYFDKLTPDGTLSFGKGNGTLSLLRTVARTLRERGVKRPADHILLVRGAATVMLVKPRPFTVAERDRVKAWVDTQPNQRIELDPVSPDPEALRRYLSGTVLTDDRPYVEDAGRITTWLADAVREIVVVRSGEVAPFMVVWLTLALQIAFTVLGGVAILVLPAVYRGASGLEGLRGVGWGLLYVSCLGYGYLAVETVLVHELVLFVGHPTYAITVVVLAMLLFSGLGSIWVQSLPGERLLPTLRACLVAVIVLGALQAYVVPGVLHGLFLGIGLGLRAALVFVLLAPLGFAMGTPFPLAMRLLRPEAAGLVPWAWALNGWTSVLASLGTVMVSRTLGYGAAHAVALAAYALALVVAGHLRGIAAEDMTPDLPTDASSPITGSE